VLIAHCTIGERPAGGNRNCEEPEGRGYANIGSFGRKNKQKVGLIPFKFN
jgi:hypothetical protein